MSRPQTELEIIPISRDALQWQCSILRLGGLTVLLNCGWTESFDPKLLSPLIPHLPDLDLILLTHADLKHLGAIPYILSKHNVKCPVVCTEPVKRIGELACVACLEDREKYRQAVDCFDVDDVLRVFLSRLTPLKYHERFSMISRGRSLMVCPYPAGGQLGSAYWTLYCGQQSAIYLVDYSLRRGRYLDGLELKHLLPKSEEANQRWDAVITSFPAVADLQLPRHGALQAPRQDHAGMKSLREARNVSEELFLEQTIGTLRKGGSVLIPVDAAGGVPEVLLLLEAAWAQDAQLTANYPLVWLSSIGDMILDQLKTRLEYMSLEVLSAFEMRLGTNPFVLRNIKVFQTLEELSAAHPLSRPKVILCTSPYLEGGDSRELFMRLCTDPRTMLWLLGVPPGDTLSRRMLDDFVLRHATRKEYRLQQHLKEALPDEQLRAWYEAKMREVMDSTEQVPFFPEAADASLKHDQAEEGAKPEAKEGGLEAKVEAKDDGIPEQGVKEKKAAPKLAPKDAKRGTLLWAPIGWPGSRTLAHSDVRHEGDEYGHVLAGPELKAWRSQDQEGNKYSFEGIEAEGKAKDEAKVEDVDAALLEVDASSAGWRESLRHHFREPMRCEVRERMVRVVCKVRFLPDCGQEPKDIYNTMRIITPKHVVVLPTHGQSVAESVIMKHFEHGLPLEGMSAMQVHHCDSKEPSLRFPLVGVKRKIQFNPEMWQKISFMKTSDDIKVARIHSVVCPPPPKTAGPRLLELGPLENDADGVVNGAGGADNSADVPSALEGADVATEVPGKTGGGLAEVKDRLPRQGALFIDLSADCGLSLSSVKEQLRGTEWTRGDVEFCPPRAQSSSSWSSRVLAADGKAALGWAAKRQRDGNGANGEQEGGVPVLRIEGVPSEQFFRARAALYQRCALV